MANLEEITENDKSIIETLVKEHFQTTNSSLAEYLLADLETNFQYFTKVYPREYKKAIEKKINLLK